MQYTATLWAASLLMAGSAGMAAAAPDWSKAPAKTVHVFYPGQSSYEWVMTKADHPAADKLEKGTKSCAKCHEGEEVDIGEVAVKGKPAGKAKKSLEPKPIANKPGALKVQVKAAHDANKLYLRFEWDDPKFSSGQKMDAKNQMKLTVLFDQDKVDGARLNGCWSTCHDDLRSMPSASAAAKSSPQAKKLGWDDGATKYLKETRTALAMTGASRGGWDKLKSDAEVEALLKNGVFLDLNQFRSGDKAVDGYVLDSRHMSGGGKSGLVASGKKEGGKWVVTMERNLTPTGPGKIKFESGKQYNFGFAIHDDYTNARYHYVSLGYSLGLGDDKAFLNAAKQ